MMARHSLFSLALLAVLALGQRTATADDSTPQGAAKPGWKLVFHDEFTGDTLDTAKWQDCHWHGRAHGNNEKQYHAPDGYEVRNGCLRLKAENRTMGGRPYTSDMATSFASFAQQYGYFEARARSPAGKGMWPAFWLLPANKQWPPEIDVLEVLGHEPGKAHMTNHYRDEQGRHKSKGGNFEGPDYTKDLHVFASQWTGKELIWYVDGVERFRSDQGIPHQPFYVIVNLAVGGDWPGGPDETTPFPGVMEIDYIRVYNKAP